MPKPRAVHISKALIDSRAKKGTEIAANARGIIVELCLVQPEQVQSRANHDGSASVVVFLSLPEVADQLTLGLSGLRAGRAGGDAEDGSSAPKRRRHETPIARSHRKSSGTVHRARSANNAPGTTEPDSKGCGHWRWRPSSGPRD